MAEKRIFVGRKAELEQFEKVLEDPKGQAILVVGQAGMGKTWLVNKMVKNAEKHPKLKCGWVRYEVTPTDSVDSTMALMMDNAFEAAQVEAGSFDGTGRQLEQWRAFLNVFGIGDLVMSLRRDPQQNTRDQFLKRLELISGRMQKNQRAIFIIDPEKYMQEKSDQSWALVVKELPERIKFVFPQRPEDALVKSETFANLENVKRIPENELTGLEEKEVEDLVRVHERDWAHSVGDVVRALSTYAGHPNSVGVALNLLGSGVPLEKLPKETTYRGTSLKEYSRVSFKEPEVVPAGRADDAVMTVISKLDDELTELAKTKLLITIMLFVVLGLGGMGVITALILKEWELIAATGTGVMVLVFWPVRRLIRIYNEERALRVIPPLSLVLGEDKEAKSLIRELMRKMIDSIR